VAKEGNGTDVFSHLLDVLNDLIVLGSIVLISDIKGYIQWLSPWLRSLNIGTPHLD
jgi:hypothetical protein